MLDTTTRKQIPYIVSVATNCNKFTPMHKYKSVSSGYGTKVSISIQYSAIIYHIICAKLPIGVSINFPCFLITKSKLNI